MMADLMDQNVPVDVEQGQALGLPSHMPLSIS